MNDQEEPEYNYRQDLSEGTLASLHDMHGSPTMPNPLGHEIPSGLGHSKMDESLRQDDYITYRILHPVACDPLPSMEHFSPYPEYIQPPYQHIPFSSIRSPWPSQEALHYGMSSRDFYQTVGSDGADTYSLKAYSTHTEFRHENQPYALLMSPHDLEERFPAQTSNICQPEQVMWNMNDGWPELLFQSCSTDGHPLSPHRQGVGRSEMALSTGPPQSPRTSAEVTFSLTPGPYVSQTICPTQIVEREEVVETKGCGRVQWEKSKRPCSCTKSQCLKLYCECFANEELCNNCNCTNCFNNTEHDLERAQAVKACLDRNPGAFQPKIGSRKQGNVQRRHTKGCNCKRSCCLKNYCECYEANIMCTSTCKCVDCRNFMYDGSPQKKSSELDRINSSIYYPTRSPLACITLNVVEATCSRLLAQAEKAEKEGYTAAHAERMILEEFGQCLTLISDSIFKSSSV